MVKNTTLEKIETVGYGGAIEDPFACNVTYHKDDTPQTSIRVAILETTQLTLQTDLRAESEDVTIDIGLS